jgi:hypothetical protein
MWKRPTVLFEFPGEVAQPEAPETADEYLRPGVEADRLLARLMMIDGKV